MNLVRVLLGVLLVVGELAPLVGQVSEDVEEGSRIRFSIATRPPGTYFVGNVVRVGNDSIQVAVEDYVSAEDSMLTVPLNLVDYLAVPVGYKNRAGLGAVIGAAVGILGGTGLGVTVGDTRECALVTTTNGVLPIGPCTGSSAERKGIIGGIIGGVVGTGLGFGIGSIVKVFTWEETWIDGMRVALSVSLKM